MIFNEGIEIETNQISDGFHTFGELYEHRIQIYITLCRVLSKLPTIKISSIEGSREIAAIPVWRSWNHSDGTPAFGGGWFVLGIYDKPGKQITYHLLDSYWEQCSFAKELERAPDFDGHTSADVLERLKQL